MSREGRKENPLVGALKTPAFWISIVSLLISSLGFYLNTLNSGTLEIYMPDQIAVIVRRSSAFVSLTVPTVLYNTGAPNNWRTIKDVDADVAIRSVGGASQTVTLTWKNTSRFVSKLDFERANPDRVDPGAEDYLVYESRKIPFSVSGRQTVTKLFVLETTNNFTLGVSGTLRLEVNLSVTSVEDKTVGPVKAAYCMTREDIETSERDNRYRWARVAANKPCP